MFANVTAVNASTYKLVEITIPASSAAPGALATLLTTGATNSTGLSADELRRVFKIVISAKKSDGSTSRAAYDYGSEAALARNMTVAADTALTLNATGNALKGIYVEAEADAAMTTTACECFLR